MARKSSKTTYVALLRGINVGGNNTVRMAELRKCVEALGYDNVQTYINSGNIIFSHAGERARIAKRLESGIEKHFGINITVVVRTRAELSALCKKIPAAWNNTTMKTDVIFLRDEVDKPAVRTSIVTNPLVDRVLYTKGALIWNLDRKNHSQSGMRKFIGTHIYKNMTARNVNTVRKLNALIST